MAEAIITGLIEAGFEAQRLCCVDLRPERLEELERRHGVRTAGLDAAVENGEILVLSVKPQDMPAVCAQVRKCLGGRRDRLCISIAAGIGLDSLRRWLGDGPALLRAMPNLGISLRQGLTALCAEADCPAQGREHAQALFETGGSTLWLEQEARMHEITAVSGSGPGFFFHLFEQMVEAAVRLGFSPQEARRLIVSAAYGSAAMAASSAESLAQLRERVTSPGGTTAAGLERLGQDDLARLYEEVFQCAAERSRQLAEAADGADDEDGQER